MPRSPGGSRSTLKMTELTETKKISEGREYTHSFSSRNFNLIETSLRILSYFPVLGTDAVIAQSLAECFIYVVQDSVLLNQVRYASYSILKEENK